MRRACNARACCKASAARSHARRDPSPPSPLASRLVPAVAGLDAQPLEAQAAVSACGARAAPARSLWGGLLPSCSYAGDVLRACTAGGPTHTCTHQVRMLKR